MDFCILVRSDPFWIGVGILIHRHRLTQLEAVDALQRLAAYNGCDVATQAAALIAGIANAA